MLSESTLRLRLESQKPGKRAAWVARTRAALQEQGDAAGLAALARVAAELGVSAPAAAPATPTGTAAEQPAAGFAAVRYPGKGGTRPPTRRQDYAAACDAMRKVLGPDATTAEIARAVRQRWPEFCESDASPRGRHARHHAHQAAPAAPPAQRATKATRDSARSEYEQRVKEIRAELGADASAADVARAVRERWPGACVAAPSPRTGQRAGG